MTGATSALGARFRVRGAHHRLDRGARHATGALAGDSRWDLVELRTQGGVLVLGRSVVGGLGGIERAYSYDGGSLRGRDVSWIADHLRDNYELFRLRSECERLGIHGLSDHVSNAQMLAVLARSVDDGQVVALLLPVRLHPLW